MPNTRAIDKMFKEYCKLEIKLLKKLDTFPRDGKECNCDDQEAFDYIHYGSNYPEVMSRCIHCGGYINDREIL